MDEHDLLGRNHHVFVKGKLCLFYQLEFFEGASKLVDQGNPVDIAYLDCQKKAFDKVPHYGFAWKLHL